MKLQSFPATHVKLIFNKLPIHRTGQPSSLHFLPLQDSASHVSKNLWDHSNSVSLPVSHLTQQQLQRRLPMEANKPSAWLCSFAMPGTRCHRLADRSPLVYIWPLASRCKRKCCAVNVDEALLQDAVGPTVSAGRDWTAQHKEAPCSKNFPTCFTKTNFTLHLPDICKAT